MSPLELSIQAVLRVAHLGGANADELLKLLRERYLLPRVQQVKTLQDAQRLFDAMGPIEFRTVLAQLDPKKAAALLKKLDKHTPAASPDMTIDLINRIGDLVSGATKPSAAPPRPSNRPRTPRIVVLPDIRSTYRAEGMDVVAAQLAGLSLADLKMLVEKQNLKASIPPGKGAPGLRKYIQVAVREELGARTDVFAAIASLPQGDE